MRPILLVHCSFHPEFARTRAEPTAQSSHAFDQIPKVWNTVIAPRLRHEESLQIMMWSIALRCDGKDHDQGSASLLAQVLSG